MLMAAGSISKLLRFIPGYMDCLLRLLPIMHVLGLVVSSMLLLLCVVIVFITSQNS